MITEDFVSVEVAKLLKEKGFDEMVISFYPPGDVQRPTHQMAMKWLREVHNINIMPESVWDGKKWEYQLFIVTPQNADSPYYEHIPYKSYEECVEAGIKYCLENLI